MSDSVSVLSQSIEGAHMSQLHASMYCLLPDSLYSLLETYIRRHHETLTFTVAAYCSCIYLCYCLRLPMPTFHVVNTLLFCRRHQSGSLQCHQTCMQWQAWTLVISTSDAGHTTGSGRMVSPSCAASCSLRILLIGNHEAFVCKVCHLTT
jgi:hypothetical protein